MSFDSTEPPAGPMPTFALLAQDALAVPSMGAYRKECVEHGLYGQAAEVQKAIDEFMLWQRQNIEKTKLPSHRHQPAWTS